VADSLHVRPPASFSGLAVTWQTVLIAEPDADDDRRNALPSEIGPSRDTG
jgi:hypothetical protein